MRKLIIAFTLILASTFITNAQQDTLKPVKGDWGFSLNISGLIDNIKIESIQDPNGNYSIFARHYLKDDQAIRIGFGLNYLKESTLFEDSVNNSAGNRAFREVDSTQSRFDFSISIGIEKHLGKTKRLDPYVGGELLIARLGNQKQTIDSNITDITGTDKFDRVIQLDGGFAFGIGGIAGFNYFFSKNISLGAEFAYAFTFVKSGGDFSVSENFTPVNGLSTSSFNNGKAENSRTSIGGVTTGSIMLSFFF